MAEERVTKVEINLERLAKALGEYSSILDKVSEDLGDLKAEIDSYLSGRSGKPEKRSRPSSKGKKGGRNRYVFNKAILAVLHKGDLSEEQLQAELKVRDSEYEEFVNALEYLKSRGIVVFDEDKGYYHIVKR